MKAYIELCIDTSSGSSSAEYENPKVRIELTNTTHSIHAVIENLIKPALLASGFTENTVDQLQLVGDDV